MTCALRIIVNKWNYMAIGLMAVLFSAHVAQAQITGSNVAPTRNGGLVEIATGDALSQTPAGLPSSGPGCVICPPNSILESEPCGSNTNQGCPVDPNLPPQPIECGQTVCGTFWRAGPVSNRDHDMYTFTLAACARVTWTVDSEVEVEISIHSAPCVVQPFTVGVCRTSVTKDLQPGTYMLFVQPSNSGTPIIQCNTPPSHYVGTLTCEPCPKSVCCENGVPPHQIIQLLSGQVNGAPGTPGDLDDAVRYSAPGAATGCTGGTLNGSYGQGFSLPFTHAVSGAAAKVVAPHPAWTTSLVGVNNTANARWINATIDPASSPPNQGSPGRSVMYYHPFTVTTPRPPKLACINFSWMVDDALGDPAGPNPLGVYLHHGYLSLLNPPSGQPISGGTYNIQNKVVVYLGPGQLARGSNKLFIYQHNISGDPGCQASGIIYHAQIEICELCNVGDVNCDDVVNVTDLLTVINNWGACPESCASCPADLNNDCAVNVSDLLIVINNWG